MLKQRERIGKQATYDYIRQQLPHFEFKEDLPSPQKKNFKYFSNENNIWNNQERLSTPRKKFLYEDKHRQDEQRLQKRLSDLEFKDQSSQRKKIQRIKTSDQERFEQRLKESLLLQNLSNQPLDEKRTEKIEKEFSQNKPSTAFEAHRLAWKQQHPRQTLPKSIENDWNRLDKKSQKYVGLFWNDKVLENEEKAIDYIDQRLNEQRFFEQAKKQSFLKRKTEIREAFLQRHRDNLELEKKSKQGVFGLDQVQDGRYSRIEVLPQTCMATDQKGSPQKTFPHKYKAVLMGSSKKMTPSRIKSAEKNENAQRLTDNDLLFQRLAKPKQVQKFLYSR